MKIAGLVLFLGVCFPMFGQSFLGDISGVMNDNGFYSEFTWRFEEDTTYCIVEFDMEREEHLMIMTFDGDTTAHVEIYEDGELAESRTYSPSEVRKEILIIERSYSEGIEMLGLDTEKGIIRMDDKEIEVVLADIEVDWNGADNLFVGDIPFTVANEKKGKFPLKITSTDLKGELEYTFEVTSIKRK